MASQKSWILLCKIYRAYTVQWLPHAVRFDNLQNTAFCTFPASRRDSGKQLWIMSVVEMVWYEHIKHVITILNTTIWTNDEVVEDSCHFQVVILPVSAVTASVATVICYHQLNGRTSTLIYVLSLDVPMASLACCLCRHDVTENSLDRERKPARLQLRAVIVM